MNEWNEEVEWMSEANEWNEWMERMNEWSDWNEWPSGSEWMNEKKEI